MIAFHAQKQSSYHHLFHHSLMEAANSADLHTINLKGMVSRAKNGVDSCFEVVIEMLYSRYIIIITKTPDPT